MFMNFNMEFLGIENQGQGCYQGNVRSEVRFSEVVLLLDFSGWYFTSYIKIPSKLRIQILRNILFFNPNSENLEYILLKEKTRYKLNRNPTEVSEG
jgi:hypothetical protein